MSNSGWVPWKPLEERRTAAFLVAGVLFLINTIHEGVGRYTAVLGEPTFLNAVIYLSALVISLVGLLGFYPRLVDHSPRLARASAGVVGVAGGALLVLLGWASITIALNQPMPPFVLLLLTLVGIVLGFVLFGITTLRARTPSRKVGLLLLAFVGVWAVGLTLAMGVYGGDAPDWLAVFLNGASSGVLLAVGSSLRADRGTTGNVESPADTMA